MPRPPPCCPRCLPSACRLRLALVLGALVWLAACSTPGPGPAPVRDGPGAQRPPNLEQVPDAEPRVEPLRVGGPNKPYEVLGRWYSPASTDIAWRETGLASWYGAKFHGRPTASGERYDMYAMTAAHKTLPLPSYVRVRNPANGREVVLRVNDRGPFVDGRVIDLSYTAALRLGVLGGVAPVEVVRITHDEIRAGLWQRGPRGGRNEVPPQPQTPLPGPTPADDDPLGTMLQDRGLAPRR
jgi:rare lipoprotein A